MSLITILKQNKHNNNSMRRTSVFILLLISLYFIYGCNTSEIRTENQQLVQISTINALMLGVYDGTTTLDEVAEFGDFGIGTFNSLDGEMILLQDTFYQVKSDGKIYRPSGVMHTPFATVTDFNPEGSGNIK